MIIKFKLLFITCLLLFTACKPEQIVLLPEVIRGQTMGTYFMIKIPDNTKIVKNEIDSILHLFNMELSTYIDSSYISQFNDPLTKFKVSSKDDHPWFYFITKKAKELYISSEGAFDPTVNPLVNYWGFGTKKFEQTFKHTKIDSIMKFVGMNKISLKEEEGSFIITKTDRRISLDYSAIAKGYGVDIIAAFLDQQNIPSYLIDIGGESRAKGNKTKKSPWKIGLNTPQENAPLNEFLLKISLKDKAIASSGNYRSFYKVNEQTFAHTINPKTGMAIGSDLLGISVITDECWMADAVATASMVKGFQEAKKWVNQLPNVEACFFYASADSIAYDLSTNFEQFIITE